MDQGPTFSWPWPSQPWSRLHIDFAGPMEHQMILVIIDAHSKWIEAIPMMQATSANTIETLERLFAQYGIPDVVVTDNGTAFVSGDFERFLVQLGITHKTSAPYHPATNGQAERAVQVVQQGLKKNKVGTMKSRLAKILMDYRTTPHSTMGETPAKLLQNRELKTLIQLVKPSIDHRVSVAQQKQALNKGRKSQQWNSGTKVWVRNFRPGPLWIPGKILIVNGAVHYTIELDNGQIVSRHADHVKLRSSSTIVSSTSEDEIFVGCDLRAHRSTNENPAPQPPVRNRFSTRNRHPPDRYAPTITH